MTKTPYNIGAERLVALANHLKFGQLGHKTFDFQRINANQLEPELFQDAQYTCGTNGCALGELPIAHPADWRFVKHGYVMRESTMLPASWFNMTNDVNEWFMLTVEQAGILFFPKCGVSDDDLRLPETATKDEVADHILKFVAANYEFTSTNCEK